MGNAEERHVEMKDTEPFREGLAVPVVAVDELHDRPHLAQAPRSLDRLGHVDGIDQPDAAVGGERMRGAMDELALDLPTEAELVLVAEAEVHVSAPRSSRAPPGRAAARTRSPRRGQPLPR